MKTKVRSRFTMILVVAFFFASFGLAGALIFFGWKPTAMRNSGELLSPPISLLETKIVLASGESLTWESADRQWQILVPSNSACSTSCDELADILHRVVLTQGKNSERVKILWLDQLPNNVDQVAQLTAAKITAQPLQGAGPDSPFGQQYVYFIDPNGFLVMRYRPGFDPTGMRKDLARLLKVTE